MRFLQSRYGIPRERIVLMGHSLGALQVLKAAQHKRYWGVIALGAANFHHFLADPESRAAYIAKWAAARGAESVDRERFLAEAEGFTPEHLFTPCPTRRVHLVFGGLDFAEGLNRSQEAIPQACAGELNWVHIPLADHMYGTGSSRVPAPLRVAHSRLVLQLLDLRLDRLLPGD